MAKIAQKWSKLPKNGSKMVFFFYKWCYNIRFWIFFMCFFLKKLIQTFCRINPQTFPQCTGHWDRLAQSDHGPNPTVCWGNCHKTLQRRHKRQLEHVLLCRLPQHQHTRGRRQACGDARGQATISLEAVLLLFLAQFI